MTNFNENISDNDFRVLGSASLTGKKKQKRLNWYHYLFIALALCCLIVVINYCYRQVKHSDAIEGSECYASELVRDNVLGQPTDTLAFIPDTTQAYTEHYTITVNDILINIFVPHNATAQLIVGVPDIFDKNVILSTQAADVRADNRRILGAFVVNGEPKSWGTSKDGFCAIINGDITVGVSNDSPLFEKATETGGYFFRQFGLVNNGELCMTFPKGKSFRKAICDRNGEIFIAMTAERESYYDFAQALIDINVSNAISLVGGETYGYFRDIDGNSYTIHDKGIGAWENENYIQWVSTNN